MGGISTEFDISFAIPPDSSEETVRPGLGPFILSIDNNIGYTAGKNSAIVPENVNGDTGS
jgi:hypothetical protein